MSTRSARTIRVASVATVVLVLAVALLSTGWHDSTGDIALTSAAGSNTPEAGPVSLLADELLTDEATPAQADAVLDQLASSAALADDELGVTSLDALAPLDLLAFPEAQPELLAMALPSDTTPDSGPWQPLWGGPFGRSIVSGAPVRSGGGGGGSHGGGATPAGGGSLGGGSRGGGSSAVDGPAGDETPGSASQGGKEGSGVGGSPSEWTPGYTPGSGFLAGPSNPDGLAARIETIPTAVPEPSTLSLAGIGIAIAALVRRRQR